MSDLGLVAADLSNPVEFHVVTQTMSSIDGGEGVDVLDFGRFAATFLSLWSHFIEPQGAGGTYQLTDPATDTTWSLAFQNVEGVIGSPHADHLVANAQIATLLGGAGDDTLEGNPMSSPIGHLIRGGEGADSMTGGDLADDVQGELGNDTITSWGGEDTLLGGQGADEVHGGDGGDLLNGNSGEDTVDGGLGADTVRGGQGADFFYGAPGADQLYGDLGDDTLHGGNDADLLLGDAGDDILTGNRGADTVDGGAGADTLRGGQSADVLSGGVGDDQFWGDLGDDTMTGGEGADVFHVPLQASADMITDFVVSEGDRVQIDGDVDYSAEQIGTDVRLRLIYGSAGDPTITVVTLRNVDLASLTDGWIGSH